MSINTKIDGDPASIRAVSGWLNNTLASQLTTSADDLAKVKGLAEAGWEGESGDTFANRTRGAVLKVDDFVVQVQGYATHMDTLAGQVRQAQTDMARSVRMPPPLGWWSRNRSSSSPPMTTPTR